jgi:NAD(P)H-quinone oxidoreductase subunit J
MCHDVTPRGLLASVSHFMKIQDDVNQREEICIKVFVSRQNPQISSIFWIWKSVDFQERESYDMLGIIHESHPCLKCILMSDSWIAWPLRKDYIVPDFYELQDAY